MTGSHPPLRALLALLMAVALAAGSVAQTRPRLLLDLDTTTPPNASSHPSPAVTIGSGWTLFSAFSKDAQGNERGDELFRTLGVGGSTSLVAEIRPGTLGSRPRHFHSLGGFALFTAYDGTEGALWRSDGTPAGTTKVAPIPADPEASLVFGGRLFFITRGQLWTSDGTAAGTGMVRQFQFGWFDAGMSMAELGGALYLTGGDTTNGKELWRSDGTAAGTVLVRDIEPGPNGSEIDDLMVHAGRLYFTAKTSAAGREVWTSDGTAAGTRLLRDVNPGPGDGIVVMRPHQIIDVAMASAGPYLFFMGFTPAEGLELWRSDGTTAGTVLVRDLRPGTDEGMPEQMVALGNVVVFAAATGPSTVALWRSDGTAAGTVQLVPLDQRPQEFHVDGNRAFFGVFDAKVGRELFVTDGTSSGTRLVKDIRTGIANADPFVMGRAATGKLLVSADDGVHGREPWSTDGTAAGTALVADIHAPPAGITLPGNPWPIVPADGITFFACRGGAAGGLWKTDGTSAGTARLSRVEVGGGDYAHLMPVGSGLYFNARDAAGTELWHTDGTAAGTRPVADIFPGAGSSYPRDGVALADSVLFTADDGRHGRELWRSDGTAAGTALVLDLYPGARGSGPGLMTWMGDAVYFVANDATGTGLWKSDGSAQGTVLLRRFSRQPTAMRRAGAAVFVFEPEIPSRVWVTDGTAQGTRVVLNLQRFYITAGMADVGSTLYVLTESLLWRLDGQTSQLVRDLGPAAQQPQITDHLTAAGRRVFFSAMAGAERSGVLWVSDGTLAGTLPVVRPGGGFVFPRGSVSNGNVAMVGAGDRRVYLAASAQRGGDVELWTSDGTTATQVDDLRPGPMTSNPSYFVHAHGRLLFRADDGMVGAEPWVLELGANAQASGRGCAGQGQPPRLSSTDPLLGATLRVDVEDARPGRRGVIGLGFPVAHPGIHFAGGCSIPIDYALPSVLVFVQTDARGAAGFSLPLPNDPSLAGLRVAAQCGIEAPATAPLGLDLSNGLHLYAGR